MCAPDVAADVTDVTPMVSSTQFSTPATTSGYGRPARGGGASILHPGRMGAWPGARVRKGHGGWVARGGAGVSLTRVIRHSSYVLIVSMYGATVDVRLDASYASIRAAGGI